MSLIMKGVENRTSSSFDLLIDQTGFAAGYEDRFYLGSEYFKEPFGTPAATLTDVDPDGRITFSGLEGGRSYWIRGWRYDSSGVLIGKALDAWETDNEVVQTIAVLPPSGAVSLDTTTNRVAGWSGNTLAEDWYSLQLDHPHSTGQVTTESDDGLMGGDFLRFGGSPASTAGEWGCIYSKQLFDHRADFSIEFKLRMSAGFVSGFCGVAVLYNGEPAYIGMDLNHSQQKLYDGSVYSTVSPSLSTGQIYTLRFEWAAATQTVTLYYDGVLQDSLSADNFPMVAFSIYLSATPSTGCLDFGPLTIVGKPAYGAIDRVGFQDWSINNGTIVHGRDQSGTLRGIAPRQGATVLRGTDSNWYRAKTTGVSKLSNKPITGAAWSDFWEACAAPVNSSIVPLWGEVEIYHAEGPAWSEWTSSYYQPAVFERGQSANVITTATSPIHSRAEGVSFGEFMLRTRNRGAGGNAYLKIYIRDAGTDALIPDSQVAGNSTGLASTSENLRIIDLRGVSATSIYFDLWMESTEAMKPYQVPQLQMAVVVPADAVADTTAPTVTFSIPATSTSLTVAVTLSATDDTGVTGYFLTESATPPLAGDAGWSATAPTEYTFADAGSHTLYAWAKDAAGNVSAGVSDTVEITLPLTIADAYSSSWADNIELSQSTGVTWPIKSITGDARTLNKTLRRFVAGTWQ